MIQRIGIFGGSFDPIHTSHVMAVAWALMSGELDQVLIIPAYRHAFGKEFGANFEQRFEMCQRALQALNPEKIQVSRLEEHRGGTSYMIETLRAVKTEFPEATLRLIIGSDLVEEVPTWRDGKQIQELAPPLVIPRAGYLSGNAEGQLPQLSSSEVRSRLRTGNSTENLIPASVLDYINANSLYK